MIHKTISNTVSKKIISDEVSSRYILKRIAVYLSVSLCFRLLTLVREKDKTFYRSSQIFSSFRFSLYRRASSERSKESGSLPFLIQSKLIKRMYQQHSLEVFQRYFKKDTKAWFSPVQLIYSHSLLHNITANRIGMNTNFLSH